MENKEYVPIDLSKNKRYATVEVNLRDCVSPEIMGEAKRIAAASTVSLALAHIRVKAGNFAEYGGCGTRLFPAAYFRDLKRDQWQDEHGAVLKYVEVTGFPFKV